MLREEQFLTVTQDLALLHMPQPCPQPQRDTLSYRRSSPDEDRRDTAGVDGSKRGTNLQRIFRLLPWAPLQMMPLSSKT